jgi:hypothetical protein
MAMALACYCTLTVSPTLAQVPYELPGPPEERPEPPATFGPIITDTAIPIEKGKFAVQPTFGLGFTTKQFNKNWARIAPGGNFTSFTMDWKLSYGLMENLEIFTVIPFVANWASNCCEPGPNGERNACSNGLADINVTVKYRLVEENKTWPTITALFATDFPTGRFRGASPHLLGTDVLGGGTCVFTTGFNMSKFVKPFIFYANFWYSMPAAFHDDDGRVFPRDFVTVNFAVEYPINSRWVTCLDFTSYYDAGRLFGRKSNAPPTALVSLSPQIQYILSEKLLFSAGVNFDLAGKNNSANITPLFSVVKNF